MNARPAPRVSIVIPAYNSAGYIRASLQSIQDQTYSDYEVIVVDDCSTDGTDDDLRVATLPHRLNLTVTPADLSIPDATTIQAVIHNTGDLVVTNTVVALNVGPADPVTGINQRIDHEAAVINAKAEEPYGLRHRELESRHLRKVSAHAINHV